MTTNDLRVGERMQHRSGVTYYSSRSLCDDLAVVMKRFPGRAATSRCFVLVHGIGVSSRCFHPLTTELAKNGEVFLIDLAGYGAVPDPKRDVPIQRHADVLGNLLQRVGIENPVLIAPTVNPPIDASAARIACRRSRRARSRSGETRIRSFPDPRPIVAELLPNGVYAEITEPHVVMHSDPVCSASLVVKHSA